MSTNAPATSTSSSNSGGHSSILAQLLATLNSLQPIGQSANEAEAIDFAHPSNTRYSGQLHHLSPEDTTKARSVFLTLHVLFPHHLLPALDLLDRGLVTRLIPKIEQSQSDGDRAKLATAGAHDREAASPSPPWEVYYIQSSSAVTSKPNPRRKKQSVSATFYEVRLDSWNCSCPAFSVDAFQGSMNSCDDIDDKVSMPQTSEQEEQLDQSFSTRNESEGVGWRVGGTTTLPSSGSTPICKHILAATLARVAPKLFSTGITESRVSREQLAGWGGGWGEFGYG
jgi:hypothetical protein